MKKTSFLVLSGLILICFTLVKCNSDKKKENTDEAVNTITPVALPTNIVPGFVFPEDSTTILGWTNDSTFANSYDSVNIYKHAWGVWAGLTAESGQKYAGDKLLVYETWLGLSEVQQLVIDNNLQGGCTGMSYNRKGRAVLTRAKQFDHAARFTAQKTGLSVSKPKKTASELSANFWVTVSYSPDAACFATQNQIFKQSVINKYYNSAGLGAIPAFPAKSLTIKPTYLVYDDTAVLFKVPVWITAPVPPNSDFGYNGTEFLANNFVFVDRSNKQPAGKVAVPVDSSVTDPAKIAAATINLSDFIYLTIDAAMAKEMNQQDSAQGMNSAKKGQIALLMAMHVTTKEISNWTWQSFYWTPNRDQPGSPSSNLAASLRPSQIKGAAANYACVAAYVMLTPNNAPNNTAKGSMFGYNPYLEGGFGSGVFTYPNTYNPSYQYGVQSNCMSCHALALASPAGVYSTDQTIDLAGPYFSKQVSLDFAWSVQTAIINDTIPYWQFK